MGKGKDTVVIRSEVSPSVESPFLGQPDKVKEYFHSNYGECEVVFSSGSPPQPNGKIRFAVVLRFTDSPTANRIKQKYNGRVLSGTRVTTCWLEAKQMNELGITESDLYGGRSTFSSSSRNRDPSPYRGHHSRQERSSGRSSRYHYGRYSRSPSPTNQYHYGRYSRSPSPTKSSTRDFSPTSSRSTRDHSPSSSRSRKKVTSSSSSSKERSSSQESRLSDYNSVSSSQGSRPTSTNRLSPCSQSRDRSETQQDGPSSRTSQVSVKDKEETRPTSTNKLPPCSQSGDRSDTQQERPSSRTSQVSVKDKEGSERSSSRASGTSETDKRKEETRITLRTKRRYDSEDERVESESRKEDTGPPQKKRPRESLRESTQKQEDEDRVRSGAKSRNTEARSSTTVKESKRDTDERETRSRAMSPSRKRKSRNRDVSKSPKRDSKRERSESSKHKHRKKSKDDKKEKKSRRDSPKPSTHDEDLVSGIQQAESGAELPPEKLPAEVENLPKEQAPKRPEPSQLADAIGTISLEIKKEMVEDELESTQTPPPSNVATVPNERTARVEEDTSAAPPLSAPALPSYDFDRDETPPAELLEATHHLAQGNYAEWYHWTLKNNPSALKQFFEEMRYQNVPRESPTEVARPTYSSPSRRERLEQLPPSAVQAPSEMTAQTLQLQSRIDQQGVTRQFPNLRPGAEEFDASIQQQPASVRREPLLSYQDQHDPSLHLMGSQSSHLSEPPFRSEPLLETPRQPPLFDARVGPPREQPPFSIPRDRLSPAEPSFIPREDVSRGFFHRSGEQPPLLSRGGPPREQNLFVPRRDTPRGQHPFVPRGEVSTPFTDRPSEQPPFISRDSLSKQHPSFVPPREHPPFFPRSEVSTREHPFTGRDEPPSEQPPFISRDSQHPPFVPPREHPPFFPRGEVSTMERPFTGRDEPPSEQLPFISRDSQYLPFVPPREHPPLVSMREPSRGPPQFIPRSEPHSAFIPRSEPPREDLSFVPRDGPAIEQPPFFPSRRLSPESLQPPRSEPSRSESLSSSQEFPMMGRGQPAVLPPSRTNPTLTGREPAQLSRAQMNMLSDVLNNGSPFLQNQRDLVREQPLYQRELPSERQEPSFDGHQQDFGGGPISRNDPSFSRSVQPLRSQDSESQYYGEKQHQLPPSQDRSQQEQASRIHQDNRGEPADWSHATILPQEQRVDHKQQKLQSPKQNERWSDDVRREAEEYFRRHELQRSREEEQDSRDEQGREEDSFRKRLLQQSNLPPRQHEQPSTTLPVGFNRQSPSNSLKSRSSDSLEQRDSTQVRTITPQQKPPLDKDQHTSPRLADAPHRPDSGLSYHTTSSEHNGDFQPLPPRMGGTLLQQNAAEASHEHHLRDEVSPASRLKSYHEQRKQHDVNSPPAGPSVYARDTRITPPPGVRLSASEYQNLQRVLVEKMFTRPTERQQGFTQGAPERPVFRPSFGDMVNYKPSPGTAEERSLFRPISQRETPPVAEGRPTNVRPEMENLLPSGQVRTVFELEPGRRNLDQATAEERQSPHSRPPQAPPVDVRPNSRKSDRVTPTVHDVGRQRAELVSVANSSTESLQSRERISTPKTVSSFPKTDASVQADMDRQCDVAKTEAAAQTDEVHVSVLKRPAKRKREDMELTEERKKLARKYRPLQKSLFQEFSEQSKMLTIAAKMFARHDSSNRAVFKCALEESLWDLSDKLDEKFWAEVEKQENDYPT